MVADLAGTSAAGTAFVAGDLVGSLAGADSLGSELAEWKESGEIRGRVPLRWTVGLGRVLGRALVVVALGGHGGGGSGARGLFAVECGIQMKRV